MSFGENLQFLRKMRGQMTQEELAQRLDVSRQTVSKWELDQAYPEMKKALELCQLFSCTMDQLIRQDLNLDDPHYSPIRREWAGPFSYITYTAVSPEPEEDALAHAGRWAQGLGLESPTILGWDFPHVSQEQANVHGMHGYTAALVLPEPLPQELPAPVQRQERQLYIAVTIRQPSDAPFTIIPNAYQLLLRYAETNGLREPRKVPIPCFEREYSRQGVDYMDVCIAVE